MLELLERIKFIEEVLQELKQLDMPEPQKAMVRRMLGRKLVEAQIDLGILSEELERKY